MKFVMFCYFQPNFYLRDATLLIGANAHALRREARKIVALNIVNIECICNMACLLLLFATLPLLLLLRAQFKNASCSWCCA